MPNKTGHFRKIEHNGEVAEAFEPDPFSSATPPLVITGGLAELHASACSSLDQLRIASTMIPDLDWYLYGFVRKEAVISSQIEGTQATLKDILTYEATAKAENPDDVTEVCNYVRALTEARSAVLREPVTVELICAAHRTLMTGARGADKHPGSIRETQNWIGGTKPGNAIYVPPSPSFVPGALAALFDWIEHDDPLPPLVRIGMAHAQFETIHPFLDGNGRIGRLLIALLLERWGLLSPPLLYISLAFRRSQLRYYSMLTRVRTSGDWNGWTKFFLRCVRDAAEDGISVASNVASLIGSDRKRLLAHNGVTVHTIRLFEGLSKGPIVTAQGVELALDISTPTANHSIGTLIDVGILHEQTGRQRDREYCYRAYLDAMTGDYAEQR